MLKQFILVAVIAALISVSSFQAHCYADSAASVVESSAVRPRTDQQPEDLMDEIVTWLASNFDLPATADRPAIAFVSNSKLAAMRAEDRASSQGFTKDAGIDEPGQRRVVALYDNNLKTIFLPDGWLGNSPANQSVLVHEMVHHLQNLAKLKFECPMAREKVAYLAQDKWLRRFGTNLEMEFELDMFTLLISSACMY